MIEQRMHVLFGDSAAGCLRAALAKVGRQDRVTCLSDSFEFGPINPPDPTARAQWADEELGVANWHEVAMQTETAISASLAGGIRPIAWLSRRDAHWYAGFLEWLSRLNDAPCDVIDVTDLMVRGRTDGKRAASPSLAISPSTLDPDQIVEAGLFDMTMSLASSVRDQYLALWCELRAENAPLRSVSSDGLVSVPITFFDPIVMSSATADWRKMARVLGEALVQAWEGDLHPVGDLVLAARIRALAECGHLEWRGDLFEMRHCEIRLPAKH
jgi:hypothetical protein